MRPIFQRNRNGLEGDCLEACLASILNLPREAVPRFNGADPLSAAWGPAARAWLKERGLGLVAFHPPGTEIPLPEAFVLVAGTSSGGIPHCCVGRILEDGREHWRLALVHDPFLPGPFIEAHRTDLEASGWRWGLVDPPETWTIFLLVALGYRTPAPAAAPRSQQEVPA